MSHRRCARIGLLVLVLLIAAGTARGAVGGPSGAQVDSLRRLGLETALRLAADQSQAAVTGAADEATASAGVRQANAAWWPTLDLQGSYTVRDHAVLNKALGFTFPVQEQSNAQYEVSLEEVLWNGGRRALAVDIAKRRREAVLASSRAGIQQAQLAVLDAYLGILELSGQSRVLSASLAALRAHHKVVADLYDQGLTARNDLLETEVRARQVEDGRAAVEDRRAIALQDLNRRIGRDPLAPAVLLDSLPAPPTLPVGRDSLIALARRNNTVLRSAVARLAAEQAAARLARRAWWPTLFVRGFHSYTESSYLVFPNLNGVVAGLSWNVFDGGARAAEVQKAEASLTVTRRQRLELQRSIEVGIDQAWRQWQQALREEETARANVAATAENLRIVSDQYRAGLARSSDVLEAEAMLSRSRYEVVTRHYATYRAQGALLVAAGWDLADFHAAQAAAPQGEE
jgi:outer membrane protein